ncbi:MAG: hypothetical protein IBX52_05030 [Bacterioplanes sp.]|nr:hypothetical protein [Bacterioplanes sp.]
MSVAHVTVDSVGYYLLEVDTSDASKALSTKVIVASAVGDIAKYLNEIERQLLKASLSWPVGLLDQLFGKNSHARVAHQKSSKEGALSADETKKWASRLYSQLIPTVIA